METEEWKRSYRATSLPFSSFYDFLWRMTTEDYPPDEVNQRTQAVCFNLSQKTAGG